MYSSTPRQQMQSASPNSSGSICACNITFHLGHLFQEMRQHLRHSAHIPIPPHISPSVEMEVGLLVSETQLKTMPDQNTKNNHPGTFSRYPPCALGLATLKIVVVNNFGPDSQTDVVLFCIFQNSSFTNSHSICSCSPSFLNVLWPHRIFLSLLTELDFVTPLSSFFSFLHLVVLVSCTFLCFPLPPDVN